MDQLVAEHDSNHKSFVERRTVRCPHPVFQGGYIIHKLENNLGIGSKYKTKKL